MCRHRRTLRFWTLGIVAIALGVATAQNETEPVDAFRILERVDESRLPPNFEPDQRPGVRSVFATVDISLLRQALERVANESVEIRLLDNLILRVTTQRVSQGENQVFWQGLVDAAVYGQAALVFSADTVAGIIHIDGYAYEIEPVYDDVVLIREITPIALAPDGAPVVPLPTAPGGQYVPPVGLAPIEPPRPTEVVILVLFPTDDLEANCVPSKYGGTAWSAEQILQDHLDRAFRYPHFGDNLEPIVVVECIEREPVGGSLMNDLFWLRADASVESLADSLKADLVSLIVPQTCSGDECVCGRGFQVSGGADADWGFSATFASCTLPGFALAHEIGHNFGLSHDRTEEEAWDDPGCNYGHIMDVVQLADYPTPAHYVTIMGYRSSCDGCPRLGGFSNPATSYKYVWVGPLQLGKLITVSSFVMGVDCNAPLDADAEYHRANNRLVLHVNAPNIADNR